jgi:hypothetical protein
MFFQGTFELQRIHIPQNSLVHTHKSGDEHMQVDAMLSSKKHETAT